MQNAVRESEESEEQMVAEIVSVEQTETIQTEQESEKIPETRESADGKTERSAQPLPLNTKGKNALWNSVHSLSLAFKNYFPFILNT